MITVVIDGVSLDVEYDYTPEIKGGWEEEPVPEELDITSIKLQDSDVDLNDLLQTKAVDLYDRIWRETLSKITHV